MSRSKLLLLAFLFAAFTLTSRTPTLAQDVPDNVRVIPVESVGFHGKLSPDGTTLVIFEDQNLLGLPVIDETLLPVRVIDLVSGKETAQLAGFTDFATDAAFTSDSKLLATYHSNGDLYLWDMTDLSAPANMWQTALLGQGRIQFMPDNKTLVVQVGGLAQRILLVDTTTGYITGMVGPHFASLTEFRENYTQLPAQGDVTFAAFALSPDGSLLATSTINDEVALWNVADNQKVVLRLPSEKYALFNIRQLLFTPDGKSVLYFDRSDEKTHIWDVAAPEETGTMDGGQLMAVAGDSSRLAWIGDTDEGGKAVFVAAFAEPDNVTKLFDLDPERKVTPTIAFLYFTSDGEQLVLGGLFAGEDLNNFIYVIDVG